MPAGVVIVGGGLAGLSAAVRLTSEGFNVTIFENRPYWGGRVSSFPDPATGWEIDNGPHLITGAYEYTRQFLQTIGSASKIDFQPHLQTVYFDPEKGKASLRSVSLPGNLSLMAGLLKFRFLRLKDKLGILKALQRLGRLNESPELDFFTADAWLIRQKQTTAARRYFWDVLCLAALNAPPGLVSFLQFFRVLKKSFWAEKEKARLGFANAGFQDVFAGPAEAFLRKRGAGLYKKETVLNLEIQNNRAFALQLKGRKLSDFDALVLAVPPHALEKMIPKNFIQQLTVNRIRFHPIVSVHLYLKTELFPEKFLAFIGGTCQWIFNMNAIRSSKYWEGIWYSVVISGAEEEAKLPKDTIVSQIFSDFQKIQPGWKPSDVLHIRVIKELSATAPGSPGAEAGRPSQKTAFKNIFLAGGWTRTGLPDTIESAVLSGELAAKEVMAQS